MGGSIARATTGVGELIDNATLREIRISAKGCPREMPRLRRFCGTVLLWTPVVVAVFLGFSGLLLGSLGMDVHWTSAKSQFIAATAVVLVVGVCVAAGLRLRKEDSNSLKG